MKKDLSLKLSFLLMLLALLPALPSLALSESSKGNSCLELQSCPPHYFDYVDTVELLNQWVSVNSSEHAHPMANKYVCLGCGYTEFRIIKNYYGTARVSHSKYYIDNGHTISGSLLVTAANSLCSFNPFN
ncbi:MAG TPA: hypothetical protein DDZ53_06275 [Firmicutes bacterium]|jgi:hypothetical protein|nr:hypothetical protein [Bacillota bacterium]